MTQPPMFASPTEPESGNREGYGSQFAPPTSASEPASLPGGSQPVASVSAPTVPHNGAANTQQISTPAGPALAAGMAPVEPRAAIAVEPAGMAPPAISPSAIAPPQVLPQPTEYPGALNVQDNPPGGSQKSGTPVIVWLLAIALAFALGLVSGAIGAREYFGVASRSTAVPLPAKVSLPPSATAAQSDVGKVADSVLASTVYISAQSGSQGGSGTGFVYQSDGVIVTNAHVIAPVDVAADEIVVVVPGGKRYPAKVLGLSRDYDIAVIKIDATGLTPLPLADSGTIAVGDQVVAVGAPLGLTGTVTTGIVSAKDRPVRSGSAEVQSFINAVQTDAAINPGNSGGPLVNMAGQMIGLNSAIAQPATLNGGNGGSIGLGFAIPSSQVKYTADEILEKGYATYPVIGIMLDMTDRKPGAVIMPDEATRKGVVPGGPADEAGLKPGDRVISVNGRVLESATEFIVHLRSLQPGQKIAIVADRSGKEIKTEVTLKAERAK